MDITLKVFSTSLFFVGYLLVANSNSVMAAPSVNELRSLCEAERQKLIAPLRQQAIEECSSQNRNTQEYCQQYYSDYGNAGRTQSGFRQRLFHEIPECLTAYDAEAQERGDTSRDTEPGKNRDSTTIDNNRETEPGKNREADPNR